MDAPQRLLLGLGEWCGDETIQTRFETMILPTLADGVHDDTVRTLRAGFGNQQDKAVLFQGRDDFFECNLRISRYFVVGCTGFRGESPTSPVRKYLRFPVPIQRK